MKLKRIFLTALATSMLVGITTTPAPVEATDFSGQEDKYMKLCSSSNLSSSNLQTCKEFNTYLKEKNQDLKEQVSNSKDQLSQTQASLDSISSEINSLNTQIEEKQKEITYLETSISNLEASIQAKEEEVKERMYAMQSYNNSNSYVDFIFGASDFSDMFARIESVNEITAYDDELVTELASEKEQVKQQKETVEVAKANIESQRASKQALQTEYQTLYAQKNAELIAQEKAAAQAADNSQEISDNLAAIAAATEQSQTSPGAGYTPNGDSAVGNAIASKALSRQGCMYLWGACHDMASIANPNTNRFDCSGLVNWAHYQAGVNIGSHSTKTLLNVGSAVSRSNMQPGDIILFSSNGSASGVHHVGIYIGNNMMVHAPSSGKPVQTSSLSSSYWQASWYQVRRLY